MTVLILLIVTIKVNVSMFGQPTILLVSVSAMLAGLEKTVLNVSKYIHANSDQH